MWTVIIKVALIMLVLGGFIAISFVAGLALIWVFSGLDKLEKAQDQLEE